MKRQDNISSMLKHLAVLAFIVISGCSGNTPPVADNNNVTTQEDTTLQIALTGSDPDGDSITYTLVSDTSHGNLNGTGPNLLYTPDENFNGTDSFTFKVKDSSAESLEATVSIMVTSVNDPPVAKNDSIESLEDIPALMIDVLTNDADPDNDNLMVLGITQGANGTVTIDTYSRLIYKPKNNYNGSDSFTYTVSDVKGGTDTAKVDIIIGAVNDAPRIITKATTLTRAWDSYIYDINAEDSDEGNILTYSLSVKPDGMTIDPNTGLIQWRPTSLQVGKFEVVAEVWDDDIEPSSDTQSFEITVASLSSPLESKLVAQNGYNQKSGKKLSADGTIDLIAESDDRYCATEAGLYTSIEFADISIPEEAKIKTIDLYIEHYVEESFPLGQLQWKIGTGWPDNPIVWTTFNAPIRSGKQNESWDSWDITSSADTSEKVNSLQFQIYNNSGSIRKNAFIDNIYAIVYWY
ncbi:Ig-like domain-containing protein [Planctomycetota bacterium]